MTDLTSLIERIEAATEGSQELDKVIWLACTPGATRDKWSYIHKATGRECTVDETRDATDRLIIVPSFTSSLDAVLTLLPEDIELDLKLRKDGTGYACAWTYHGNRSSNGATLVLAALSAILRARQAMQMEVHHE